MTEEKEPEKKYHLYEYDEKKGIKYQFVEIASPIMLGVKIGIGIFIVLPLFVIAIFFILLLLMAIFGGIVGY